MNKRFLACLSFIFALLGAPNIKAMSSSSPTGWSKTPRVSPPPTPAHDDDEHVAAGNVNSENNPILLAEQGRLSAARAACGRFLARSGSIVRRVLPSRRMLPSRRVAVLSVAAVATAALALKIAQCEHDVTLPSPVEGVIGQCEVFDQAVSHVWGVIKHLGLPQACAYLRTLVAANTTGVEPTGAEL